MANNVKSLIVDKIIDTLTAFDNSYLNDKVSISNALINIHCDGEDVVELSFDTTLLDEKFKGANNGQHHTLRVTRENCDMLTYMVAAAIISGATNIAKGLVFEKYTQPNSAAPQTQDPATPTNTERFVKCMHDALQIYNNTVSLQFERSVRVTFSKNFHLFNEDGKYILHLTVIVKMQGAITFSVKLDSDLHLYTTKNIMDTLLIPLVRDTYNQKNTTLFTKTHRHLINVGIIYTQEQSNTDNPSTKPPCGL